MRTEALTGGFDTPAIDAAHAFRAILSVMARPGEIQTISGAMPPLPVSPAAGAVLLTLCDTTTPLFLSPQTDTEDMRNWVRFHTGAPLVPVEAAQFALGAWGSIDIDALPLGTPEYPDRSATVIVEMPRLEASGATLRGPGIKDTARLNLPEIAAFQNNRSHFPLGRDFIFTCGDRIAALPRSTEVR